MTDQETRGVWIGLSGYILWGLSPIFWKALNQVEAMDIVSWRVICTFLFVAVCNLLLRLARREKVAPLPFLRNKLSMLGGGLIGLNWGMFVWAVESERVVVKVVPQDEYDTWVQDKKDAAFRMAELTEKDWSADELTKRGEGVYLKN